MRAIAAGLQLAVCGLLVVLEAGCGGGSGGGPQPPTTSAHLASSVPTGAYEFGDVHAATEGPVFEWTITNDGDAATVPLATTITGGDSGDFVITDGCAGKTLPPAAPCTIHLQFKPRTPGTKGVTLAVAAGSVGPVLLAATGNGTRNAQLASSLGSTHSFGRMAVSYSSEDLVWTITNSGTTATDPLVVSSGGANPEDFYESANGCQGVELPAGQSCSISLRFQPTLVGNRTASWVVSDPSSGYANLALGGTGGWALFLSTAGAGTVTQTPGESCGTGCSVYLSGTTVVLQARTSNGSGYHFQGWGGSCQGSFRDCTITLNANQNVYATFAATASNLVFVTKGKYPTNLGGVGQYDAKCNELATAAGINNASGDAYVAWVSGSTSTAASRIGTSAQGWTLLDGRRFTDTLAGLTLQNHVWNGIDVDETGWRQYGGGYVLTGTRRDGSYDTRYTQCAGYTSTSDTETVALGYPGDGPYDWTGYSYDFCSSQFRLYCFMKTSTAPLAPVVPQDGKRLWVTRTTFAPSVGLTVLDAQCNAERPAGASSGRALVATASASAGKLLSPDVAYYTTDWQLVGTGAQLQSPTYSLRTGIWQYGNGGFLAGTTNLAFEPLTGADTVSEAGTADTTCNGWTSNSSSYHYTYGWLRNRASNWFGANNTAECSTLGLTYPVVCVEP